MSASSDNTTRPATSPPPYSAHDPGSPPQQQHGITTHGSDHGRLRFIDATWMHPLMRATALNQFCSLLASLPDIILICIIRQCDLVSALCLRQSSRIFLRLFAAARPDLIFHRKSDFYDSIDGMDHRYARPAWPLVLAALCESDCQKYRTLLSRDKYCADCQKSRLASDWTERYQRATHLFLHCSGCDLRHPLFLFSRAERHKQPGEQRICIGREGSLRLCRHKTVSWDTVAARVSSDRISTNHDDELDEEPIDECQDPCLSLLVPSHLVHCARYNSLENTRHRHIHPTVSCTSFRGVKKLFILWQAHVPIENKLNEPMATVITRELGKLRQGQAQFACPELAPGEQPETQLFDPNFCRCISYEGSDRVNWVAGVLNDVGQCAKSSLCEKFFQNIAKTSDINELRTTPDDIRAAAWQSHKACVLRPEKSHMGLYNKSQVSASACLSGQACLQVSYEYSIILRPEKDGVLRCIPPEWFELVDPDTFKLTEDIEGLGLYWCKSPRCRNYYKYGRSRLQTMWQWVDAPMSSVPMGLNMD